MTSELKAQVLIVEDQANIRMLYRGTLTMGAVSEHDVVFFEDAESALVHYKENRERVRLVVSDFDLGPDRMNGGTFLRRVIKENAKYESPTDVKTVMISTHADRLSAIDDRVVGSKMTKPLSPRVLLAEVNRLLQ